jgi:hypothetical protein
VVGSRDIEGLEDTMANREMTELEAIIFHGLNAGCEDHPDWDNQEMAKFLAQFLVDHLPETSNADDHPAERPSPAGL